VEKQGRRSQKKMSLQLQAAECKKKSGLVQAA
jgi:hypothetical protein